MKDAKFFNDLLFLLQHLYAEPDKAVKRWTMAECNDYQIPIALLTSFLAGADTADAPVHLRLRDAAPFKAIAEIVQNSHLRSLLEVDYAVNCVRFRDGISAPCRKEIADFVVKNAGGCIS